VDDRRPVVVGVDGSENSLTALLWAAAAAHAHAAPLAVVHADPDEEGEVVSTRDPQKASSVLADAAARVSATQPVVEVTLVQHPGSPVEALLETGHDAAFVVVGSRGLGGFAGLLLGSTPMQVVPHAQCPVVVVRPGTAPRPDAEVIVGYDGSQPSAAAAAFGFWHAAATGSPVRVVAVGAKAEVDEVVDVAALPIGSPEATFWAPARVVAEEYPAVSTSYHSVAGRPARALVDQGEGGALLVLGTRGLGGFRGLLQGSVSQQVLHHASSPVAMVRLAGEEG
jgi:nucleotide-binding universal stress UspA family protein